METWLVLLLGSSLVGGLSAWYLSGLVSWLVASGGPLRRLQGALYVCLFVVQRHSAMCPDKSANTDPRLQEAASPQVSRSGCRQR